MADKRIKGITIEIGADTTGLDKALRDVEKGANKAKSELRDVDRLLKDAPDSAVLWAQKQDLLTKAVEESRKKLDLLKNSQEDVEKQFKSGKIGEDQYRAFQRELEKAKNETENFERKLKELKESADDASDKVDDLSDSTKEAGENVEESGDGFTILKGIIADLAADGIKAAIDGFKELADEGDKALNGLQAQTGATAAQMEQYKEVMDNLYANNYGEDRIDIADSIAAVKQQLGELDSSELENVTEKAFILRDTFGFEIKESIRTADMLMNQFEVSADEAFALIAQGAQNGLDKNGDLLDTINEYSVHYKTLGYNAEEFFNSLSNGTEAGTFSVDKLGDAMKEFGIRAKDTADSTTEGFQLIGLDADNMRTKFAEGGETAKQATEETIRALFALDDKVIQNQAGVALFGTMWEDLQASGIQALTTVTGEADKTATTLEDIAAVKYNDLGSQLESLGKKAKTELVEPIVEKALPKLKSGTEWLIENLPEIEEIAKDMLPLIQGIGTGFISWKALSGIGAGISKAKELTDILKNTSNFAGLASSGILGIAGALAIGVGSYVYSANKAKEEKLDKIFEEVTEASDLCAESIKENADKMSELKETVREAADSELALTDNTENLWKELQLLVDENGRVKEGYEDRVAFISNELTEATGEEIALIDGQIQKYDDLKAKIGEVIERQRAEILQRSYSSAYEEAISQNSSTAKDIVAARSRIDEQSAFISQMYGNARKDFESVGMLSDFTKLGNLSLSNLDSWKDVFSDEELAQLRGAFTAIEQERANISGYQQQYSDNAYIISQYEKAQEAMLAGNYNNAQIAFSAIDDLEYASLQDSKKNLDEKLDAIDDMVDESVRVYKEGIALGDKYARDTFSGTIATIIQQATEGGISAGELLESGIVTELSKIDGFDATMLLEFANALGVDFGTVFGYVSADKASSIMTQYLYSVNDLIPQNINSQSDYELYKQGKYAVGIPMMADGGFLHNGAAVVSEAGPELLEIINGGARVTPLTGSAKNTAVNGTGTRNVTVNQNIYVNELKNSYDTRRMAQDLSAETRRVESGKGKR